MPWSPPSGPEEHGRRDTNREDEARVHEEACRGPAGGGGGIHTQHPGKSLCRGEGQVQMMVLPVPANGDGASGAQPDLSPLSSPLASSSSLSLKEELSSSVELSTQHPNRSPKHSKTLTESRSASIN
jgi:hypothetical protein